MLSADHLWPHALLRVGHKGLFFDRLDVGVAGFAESAPIGGQPGTGASLEEPPRLVPFAQGFYHVRNRVYVPQFGRWLQRDPNASGMAVMDSLAYHGGTQAAAAMAVDMEGMYSDGLSLYQYLVGSPWSRSDPKGLYTWEDGFEDVTDVLGLMDPIPGPSDYIREALKALTEDYAANLEWDAEWASEWDYDDDWHTRGDNTWVTEALGRGLYEAFDISLPFGDESINPLEAFANGHPSQTPGSGNVMRKGTQRHHIATKDGKWGREFKALFDSAGVSIHCDVNLVDIPHGGRHARGYHEFVYRRLKTAVGDLPQPQARVALEAELKKLKSFIKKNPHFLQDSSGGTRTGWKGMRDMYGPKPAMKRRRR